MTASEKIAGAEEWGDGAQHLFSMSVMVFYYLSEITLLPECINRRNGLLIFKTKLSDSGLKLSEEITGERQLTTVSHMGPHSHTGSVGT